MGFFNRSAESTKRDADDALAQAEVDRLVSLTPAGLGVELIAAFGPDGAQSRGNSGVAPMQIIQWLMRSVGRGVSTKPLVPVVPAGLRAMQDAGLVEARGSGIGTGTFTYRLTPLGERALADGSASSYLNS